MRGEDLGLAGDGHTFVPRDDRFLDAGHELAHRLADRIAQAKDDWRAGRFPAVPGDGEYIAIPDQPKTVSYP